VISSSQQIFEDFDNGISEIVLDVDSDRLKNKKQRGCIDDDDDRVVLIRPLRVSLE